MTQRLGGSIVRPGSVLPGIGLSGILLALVFFCVIWPAWSGYEIRSAIEARDGRRLERKVDLASVRTSLRPVVEREVDRRVGQAMSGLGAAGQAIGQTIKREAAPRITENVLNALVTPDSIIRIATHTGTMQEAIETILKEQSGTATGDGGTLGKIGQILDKVGIEIKREGAQPAPKGGAQAAPAPAASPPRPRGPLNVMSFAVTGFAQFEVGLARDPNARTPDLYAGMAFTNADWKLVSLRPLLRTGP